MQTSLTYRDMVFIDHSVNDDAVFGNAVQSKSIGKSLETIIRKLLLIGVGSGPNIFILNTATRVYLNSYIGMDSCKDLSKELVIKQYPTPPRMQLFSDLYNSVGDHYHIPILSYRDLVWKYNSSETVGDVDFLTGLRIAGYSELHPPWYVHQLWADLIARSIELDWEEQCTSMHDTVSDSHTGSSAFSALVVSLNHHRPSLPYLLFNASDGRLRHQGESFCLKDIAPLLDEDSADLIGSTHTHSGSNHTHSRLHFHEHTHRHSHTVHLRSSTGNASFISNGWRLVEERRKKVGWISELPPDARETMVVQNLTFPLTVDMQLPDSNVSLSELWHKRVIAVHIYALRTYFNAGSIDVHLCGSNLGSIDVLWEEYELLKVSMPELFSFMIAESNIGGGPRSVRYGFSYPHPCIDPKHPQTLVLSHKYYEDDHSIARNSTQKVKVMSVKACVVGTTDDYAAMIYRN